MSNPVDLDHLDKLYAAATQGEWKLGDLNGLHADDQHYIVAAANSYPALAARIRELEAIVAKLPKTADGVPVVPGMTELHEMLCGEPHRLPPISGFDTDIDGRLVTLYFCDRKGTGFSRCFGELYSTREKAQEAANAK